ncbi:PaeR7I family type II restriction endonuclease [Exiguobacterium sp. s142]|uniref:Eco57I restriction-modification methylase domain-containing protein n=1 Tax=Exiguobacterium sp. s142 TaxID=2751222 RepID=UPI001BE55501|nr:PaeR7I family type II restriction endonuclease [Exiguobacterium sp. s142]
MDLVSSVSSSKSLGQYFTKPEVVELMLDLFGYSPEKKLFTQSILEPATGDGVFLLSIVDRLFESFVKNECFTTSGKLKKSIFMSAKTAIVAVELDSNTYLRLTREVQNYLIEKGMDIHQAIELSESWLVNSDFLLWNRNYELRFDYVVGNPPYIRNENMDDSIKKLYRDLYVTYYDRADIYVPFIEHSLLMLKPKGICSFICTDRFIKNNYGRKLRKFITDSYKVKYFLDIHNSSPFEENVSAYPCIFGFSSDDSLSQTYFAKSDHLSRDEIGEVKNFILFDQPTQSIESRMVDNWFEGEEPWVIDFEIKEILDGIKMRFPTISNVETIDCKIGIATGATDLFVVDESIVNDYQLEKELLVPLITKKHLTPEGIEWNGTYTIQTFQSNGEPINLDNYPRLQKYLLQFKEKLSKRAFVKKNPDKWFWTKEKVRVEEIEKPKIMWKDIGNSTKFFEEKGCYYPEHSLYYLLVDGYDSRLLKHILNSFIALAFVKAYSTTMRGDYFRFQKQNIEQICVPLEVDKSTIDQLDKAIELNQPSVFNSIIAKIFGLDDRIKNLLLSYVGLIIDEVKTLEIRIPNPDDLKTRVSECFKHYADVREGGTQHGATMEAFEHVIIDLLVENGVERSDIITGRSATVPGYFRRAKAWDVLIKKRTENGLVLIGVIECKSQKGSVGNNSNNRAEEVVGSGYDLKKANQKLGLSAVKVMDTEGTVFFEEPFVGFVFLLGHDFKNAGGDKRPQKVVFDVDSAFIPTESVPMNYKRRLEILNYRLMESGLYSAATLVLEDPNVESGFTEPSEQLSFYNFIARMLGSVVPKYHTIS